MATSTQAVGGLVSGLNPADIVPKLMAIEARPMNLLQDRITKANQEKEAYQQISTKLLNLMSTADVLSKSDFFNTKSANSSNSNVLSASASTDAVVGTYIFTINTLARNAQSISNNFSAKTSTVGAGNITVELGDQARLSRETSLNFINSQAGFQRGKINITDRAGNNYTIDLTMAANITDVLNTINNTQGIKVSARIKAGGDGLELIDNSGGAGNLTVSEAEGGSAAQSLGIKGSIAGITLTGTDINKVTTSTSLSSVNDGVGVRTVLGNDIFVQDNAAISFSVDLSGNEQTVNDIITAYNAAATAAGSASRLSINASGTGLVASNITVLKGENSSSAALDLGLVGGTRLIGGLNDVLLRNLNGGASLAADGLTVNGGVVAGNVTITDRSGANGTVNTAGQETLRGVMNLISDSAGFSVTAAFNSSGNGLRIVDDTGAAINPLQIAGAGAVSLGIDTPGAAGNYFDGRDLDIKYLSEATVLSSMNAGKGVYQGSIKVTNTAGVSATIDLSTNTNLNSVLLDISYSGINVTASINSTGDGLILTDTAGGAGRLTIEEVGSGTSAKDLGILGTADSATPTVFNGSFEKTVTVGATDTLENVVSKINALGIDVSASIINDGTQNPYRLSVVSSRVGRSGDMLLGTDISGLAFNPSSVAQDSKILLGSSQAGVSPVLITKNTNSITDIVTGLTLNIKDTSSSPVTVTVNNDTTTIVDKINTFVKDFNDTITDIKGYTSYDTEKQQAGLLMGDSFLSNLENQLADMIVMPIPGLTGLNMMYEVGMTLDDKGKLNLDSAKLQSALNDDLTGVMNLFTYSANVALESNGGFPYASSTAAGFDARNAANGNSNSEDFGVTNGWQDDTPGVWPDYYTIQLDKSRYIDSMKIYQINSLALPFTSFGVSSFGVEYLMSDGATWKEFSKFESSTATSTTVAFDRGFKTSALRVRIDGSNDNTASRLVDVQVNENRGFAALVRRSLDFLTNTNDGTLTTQVDSIDERVADFQTQIENMQAVLNSKEAALYNEFYAMEAALSNLNSQMAYFTSQMGGTSSSK